MTMIFRQVKESLINSVIGPAAAGRFRLTGFQNQTNDASEVLGSNRLVQIYYKQGTFSKIKGRMTGPVQHDMIFQLDLTVSTGFVGDVSVINNPSSTQAQLAAALAAFQEASGKADESVDELFDILYQIIMDGRNVYLGLDKNVIGERWLSELQKDQPIERGEYAVLTASMQLTVSAGETVDGDTGLPADTIQNTIALDGDTAETGVTVTQ